MQAVLRRLRETVKDLDFIIATEEPEKVKEKLAVRFRIVKEIIAAGPRRKCRSSLDGDFDVSIDFRIVAPAQYASDTKCHHFTGSKDHNVKIRQIAKERNEKVSEYGVEQRGRFGEKRLIQEEALYNHFDLPWFPPEIREDGTENGISIQKVHWIELVFLKDIKG